MSGGARGLSIIIKPSGRAVFKQKNKLNIKVIPWINVLTLILALILAIILALLKCFFHAAFIRGSRKPDLSNFKLTSIAPVTFFRP
jgi:hypothetical protein